MRALITTILVLANITTMGQHIEKFREQKRRGIGMMITGVGVAGMSTMGSDADKHDELFQVGAVGGGVLFVGGIVMWMDARKHYRRENAAVIRELKQAKRAWRKEKRRIKQQRIK